MTAETSALLACLLSGYPAAEKCHADLVAKGPAAIKEIKPELVAAVKNDAGDDERDRSNISALTSTRCGDSCGSSDPPAATKSGRRKKGGGRSAERRGAEAAAEELARLGDWKVLLAFHNTPAAVGLAKLEAPTKPVFDALLSWIKRSDRPVGEVNRRGMAASGALKAYGPKCTPILPVLIKWLDIKDLRYEALTILEKMGPAAAPAVPRLGKMLKDKDWESGARDTLGGIKTPEAEKLLYDNPPWVVAPN